MHNLCLFISLNQNLTNLSKNFSKIAIFGNFDRKIGHFGLKIGHFGPKIDNFDQKYDQNRQKMPPNDK